MKLLNQIIPNIRTLTFDCYGTLIDWETGLRAVIDRLSGAVDPDAQRRVFDVYLDKEAEVEAEPYRSYRVVTAEPVRRVAGEVGLEIVPADPPEPASAIGDWLPFPDTNEVLKRLARKFRLGILSNIDRDLFARTARRLDVSFDFVVTAEDVRSYKPAHGHFTSMLADHAEPGSVLHVAQSLFHDGVPARALGIPFVWINRRAETNTTTAEPLAVCPDLKSLAELIA